MTDDVITGRLINCYYYSENNQFMLYFVILTEDYRKITIPWQPEFKPYMYTTGEGIIFLKQCFDQIKASCKITRDFSVQLLGKPIDEYAYKVETDTPDKIGHIKRLNHWKENIHFNDKCFFEGNIAYVLRYLIDMGFGIYLKFILKHRLIRNWEDHPEIEPRKLYFDIETHGEELLSISYASDMQTIRNHLASEEELFKGIKLLMEGYDFFISWTAYDEKFLKKRAKELKIDIDWNQICFIDQEFIMKETNRKCAGRSYLSLDTAAEILGLKIRKIPMPKGLKWYYDNDRDRFIRYNNRDVEIQLAIEEVCGAVSVWIAAISDLGIPLDKATHVGIIAEVDWLRKIKTKSKRILLPNGKKTKTDIGFEGGGVTSKDKRPYGVFSNVFAVDLAGSYAGIIRTYNISPEVWSFVTKSFSLGKGVFPELIEERTERRNEYKRLMRECHKGSKEYKFYKAQQEGQKIIILQYWGQIGRETSPFYILDVAAYITEMGRKHIELSEQSLDDDFGDIAKRLYKDTDSIYFSFDLPVYTERMVKDVFKQVLDSINSALDFLLDIKGIPMNRRFVKMEAQAFYDKVLWAGIAKNYMYLERYSADTDEWHNYPQLGIRGWVKLGSGRLALDVQHMIGRLIMDGVPFNDLIGYLQCIRDDIFKGRYDEGLVQDTGLSMPLKKYKSKTYVWHAAKRALDKGLYQEKTNLRWVITENRVKPHAEGVFEGVIPRIEQSGYEYLFDNRVLNKAISVMKSIEKDEKKIRSLVKVSSKAMSLMFGD